MYSHAIAIQWVNWNTVRSDSKYEMHKLDSLVLSAYNNARWATTLIANMHPLNSIMCILFAQMETTTQDAKVAYNARHVSKMTSTLTTPILHVWDDDTDEDIHCAYIQVPAGQVWIHALCTVRSLLGCHPPSITITTGSPPTHQSLSFYSCSRIIY